MKALWAKVVLRVLGTLMGCLGLFSLGMLLMLVWSFATSTNALGWGASVVLGLLFTVFAGFFLRAAWLVWFRFSPSAVRQVCGATAFILFAKASQVLGSGLDTKSALPGLLSLAILVASFLLAYWFYDSLSNFLNRLLFPPAQARSP